jgi:soluble lytic murein transglycosylase-like protein
MAKIFGIEIYSEDDLMKPEINIAAGTAFLMRLTARYGNLPHAIMAYNIGAGAMDGRLRRQEKLPVAYYEKVMAQYRKLLASLEMP